MRILVVTALLAGDAAADPRAQIDAITTGKLRKLELRPTMKKLFPSVRACYERELKRTPKIAGVVNTQLTIRNDPKLGMTLTVDGFDTDGALGTSQPFLACVKATFEARVFPAIATRGIAHVTYPGTFSTEPLGDRDKPVVDRAVAHAKAARWTEALAAAGAGLKLTSLDGPLRRQLIEIGGVAACHLRDDKQARRYYALASPEHEAAIEQACAGGSALP